MIRVRAMVMVIPWVRFRVYLLHLLHFYQAYYTLIVHYCYVTGSVLISFQISRSIGVSLT